jgi:hypothetical protein
VAIIRDNRVISGSIGKYARIALACVVLSGCSRTVITQCITYPSDSVEAQAKYRLWIESAGALGRPYAAQSRKRVQLWIYQNQQLVFRTNLLIAASDLGWHVSWLKASDLQIRFVDQDVIAKTTNIVKELKIPISETGPSREQGSGLTTPPRQDSPAFASP